MLQCVALRLGDEESYKEIFLGIIYDKKKIFLCENYFLPNFKI
jgi:hypothetical protein